MAFGRLRFLYVASKAPSRDASWYVEKAGARLLWDLNAFGAHVAAVDVGSGVPILFADHRPAPSVMPVYEVHDLESTVASMQNAGWKPTGEAFEIPSGPCRTFQDPAGVHLALFEDVRPDAMADLGQSSQDSATR